MYKLERNEFKIQSVKEASNHSKYYKKKSPEERLAIAFYLNSIAFNFDINNPPRLDRTVYSERKLTNG